jgi:bisphosphoglycerate-independent phosphoglycerate mutase (AlkP superfamily)
LRDIAPTLLGALGVPEPPEMTGGDLRITRQ